MTRRPVLTAVMAGLLALASAGCARQPTVGGDLALLFIPTPIRLIGCVLGGCERTPVEGEYKGEMSP